jgi:hypothetical protein
MSLLLGKSLSICLIWGNSCGNKRNDERSITNFMLAKCDNIDNIFGIKCQD